MPKFVFLWTDLVLWLVVAIVIGYVVHVRRSPNLRATWRHVLRSAPTMSAAVVLIVFIAIALLDSIHFRPRLSAAPGAAPDIQQAYATRTLSPLDVLLRHAVDAREKTYSVPLAYWSFQRETAVIDGKEVRELPR
ncbi:MAG TPA: ABC transporter permease, partial [Burkholderiaceae bacterium]|nr:ABC transporter permease [Burkholderiaceae bacterium]